MKNSSVGLAKLCEIVLEETIDKCNTVRFSDWMVRQLNEVQRKYAALDVIVSRRIFIELEKRSDLTRRLDEKDTINGKKVELVPRHGSIASMATRAVTANIVEMEVCHSPDGILPKKARCDKGFTVVRLETIHSPALKLPWY